MSTQNEKRGKIRKVDSRKLAVRIIAWILILMTVVTTLYTAIFFIIEEVSAAEVDELNIAVGLVYGDSVDVAFTATTIVGFTVGSETVGLYQKSFTPLLSLPDTKKVSVLGDRNFSKTSLNKYYHSGAEDTVAVGGYHIELDAVYADNAGLTSAIASVNTTLAEKSLYAIPSYINGERRIRIGQYSSLEAANSAMTELLPLFPEQTMHTVSPSLTGTTLVDHTSAKILFEYDCGESSYLALEPIDNPDGTPAYTRTPADNIYDGVFVYKRYVPNAGSSAPVTGGDNPDKGVSGAPSTGGTPVESDGGIDGIQVTNVLPIEDYILGVVPYEVPPSWPLETLKAFAVISRTYVVAEIDQYWNKYGFNVCNTTASQVYRGAAYADHTNVKAAIEATKGQVMTYNGALAPVYYSSSVGDSTVDSRYIWGQQDMPWLRSVWTPWEAYRDHSNAFWTKEVSPSDLQIYLKGKGYTKLNSPIASITVDETAGENSNYVYQVTVKDQNGNSVIIKRTDKVKSAFSSYLGSANFVVGKGSVTYTTYTNTITPDLFSTANDGTFTVLTSLGKLVSSFKSSVSVMTSNGKVSFLPTSSVTVLTGDSYQNGISESIRLEEYATSHLKTETATATDPNNFIFVGKGWGHGLGLSQWGLHDLAGLISNDGDYYKYDEMLKAYCSPTDLTDYKDLIGEHLPKITE